MGGKRHYKFKTAMVRLGVGGHEKNANSILVNFFKTRLKLEAAKMDSGIRNSKQQTLRETTELRGTLKARRACNLRKIFRRGKFQLLFP